MSNVQFADIFKESHALEFDSNSITKGTVLQIYDDFIIVDVGLKSEAIVPARQFMNLNNELEVKPGDVIEIAVDYIDDGNGATGASREKAKRIKSWHELVGFYESGETVEGTITGRVKGGFTVEMQGGVKAFLPGSLVDIRPVKEGLDLEGKTLEFKIIKVDHIRNNIVVSRRSVIASENNVDREALLAKLEEGATVKGVVKNLTDYGAFIDLGGVDGLLHITDMSWKRIKHPKEIMQLGDEINVKVLSFDKEKSRVSLGLKQLGDDPWKAMQDKFVVSQKVPGIVSNITDYGCFVEISDGIEGLVHISEMDWTNKNVNPHKFVQLGQSVEVVILELDDAKRRISLGMKQCQDNPWKSFEESHGKGDKLTGVIKSITDFGVFVGLDGDIDGLIHINDISWNTSGEEAIRQYKKGQEIEIIILGVDAERERISLGVKQLQHDPFMNFAEENDRGSKASGSVTAVDAKAAVIQLAEGLEGILKASDFSDAKGVELSDALKEGQELDVFVLSIDRRNRKINLSTKEQKQAPEIKTKPKKAGSPAKGNMSSGSSSMSSSLGDLFRKEMSDEDKD
tara:strand:- start:8360 stop:10069 length:1710 start_codon:yes stop_codon:yes gene_type:complete